MKPSEQNKNCNRSNNSEKSQSHKKIQFNQHKSKPRHSCEKVMTKIPRDRRISPQRGPVGFALYRINISKIETSKRNEGEFSCTTDVTNQNNL